MTRRPPKGAGFADRLRVPGLLLFLAIGPREGSGEQPARLRVNGTAYPVSLEPGTTLLVAIRESVGDALNRNFRGSESTTFNTNMGFTKQFATGALLHVDHKKLGRVPPGGGHRKRGRDQRRNDLKGKTGTTNGVVQTWVNGASPTVANVGPTARRRTCFGAFPEITNPPIVTLFPVVQSARDDMFTKSDAELSVSAS